MSEKHIIGSVMIGEIKSPQQAGILQRYRRGLRGALNNLGIQASPDNSSDLSLMDMGIRLLQHVNFDPTQLNPLRALVTLSRANEWIKFAKDEQTSGIVPNIHQRAQLIADLKSFLYSTPGVEFITKQIEQDAEVRDYISRYGIRERLKSSNSNLLDKKLKDTKRDPSAQIDLKEIEHNAIVRLYPFPDFTERRIESWAGTGKKLPDLVVYTLLTTQADIQNQFGTSVLSYHNREEGEFIIAIPVDTSTIDRSDLERAISRYVNTLYGVNNNLFAVFANAYIEAQIAAPKRLPLQRAVLSLLQEDPDTALAIESLFRTGTEGSVNTFIGTIFKKYGLDCLLMLVRMKDEDTEEDNMNMLMEIGRIVSGESTDFDVVDFIVHHLVDSLKLKKTTSWNHFNDIETIVPALLKFTSQVSK